MKVLYLRNIATHRGLTKYIRPEIFRANNVLYDVGLKLEFALDCSSKITRFSVLHKIRGSSHGEMK